MTETRRAAGRSGREQRQKIFQYWVINLRSRVDRLLRIQDGLKHPFTIHPAVTRVEVASGKDVGARRFDSWIDPLLHRPINDAEVACFLSHFALWRRCSAGTVPFVILEDDVEQTADWNEDKIREYLGDPADERPAFDLLYLNYREMDQARPATSELVYPSYPYWTCAYAVTPIGARKLLTATPLTNGVIPADEFLASMIGYRHRAPNEEVNHTYARAPRLRAAAVRRPMYRVASRKILRSDIESPIAPRVAVATVATEYEAAGILLESTLKNEVPEVTVLGVDHAWRSGDPAAGESGWDKIAFMKSFLADRRESRTLQSSDVILFVDGYDTFIHDHLDAILERFLDFKCHVLFAAEKSCWPRRNVTRQWPETHTEYRYLNSGAYIGYLGAIEEMLKSWEVSKDADDQQFFIERYLDAARGTSHLELRLDHECAIFQCLNGVDSGELITTASRELTNTRTNSRPRIVHGNGPDKAGFVKLATELGYRPSITKAMASLRRRASAGRSVTSGQCRGHEPEITYIDNPRAEYTVFGPEMLLVDFMTVQACADLIEFTEKHGNWAPMVGDKFPAQEIRIRDLSLRLFRELEVAWKRNIDPVLEKYWRPVCMYGLRDAFLVKYTVDTQCSLALHNDASLVTGSVKLNDAYGGGKLVWPRQNVTNDDIPTGKLILFPGQVTHGHSVEELISGSKYSLTIWTSRFKGDVNY